MPAPTTITVSSVSPHPGTIGSDSGQSVNCSLIFISFSAFLTRSLCLAKRSNLGEESGETGMWGQLLVSTSEEWALSGSYGIGYPRRDNSFEGCVGCLMLLFVNVFSSLASLGWGDYRISLKCH